MGAATGLFSPEFHERSRDPWAVFVTFGVEARSAHVRIFEPSESQIISEIRRDSRASSG